jgi:AraC family transcriptional regulator
MKLVIKNMVCQRCIMAVESIFKDAGIQPVKVSLGEVELPEEISMYTLDEINNKMKEIGFEIIDSSKAGIIEKVKNVIIEAIHYSDDEIKINFSAYIELKLNKNYTYLSNLFSAIEGTTIEKYIIRQKIEKVKELLVYDELTLSEIAFKTGYSSVAHLSSQFKKVTGLTPSYFKELGENKRKSLDSV